MLVAVVVTLAAPPAPGAVACAPSNQLCNASKLHGVVNARGVPVVAGEQLAQRTPEPPVTQDGHCLHRGPAM